MKKLVFKKTGEEVELGDRSIVTTRIFGSTKAIVVEEYKVSEETIPELIQKGIIKEVDDGLNKLTIQDAVQHLADRIGWKKENIERYFNGLYKINPIAVFDTILKEIAIILDEQYEDHISNSPEIWGIDTLNCRVIPLIKENITSYKHFAAFRSKEEAEYAKKIMAPAIKNLYGE